MSNDLLFSVLPRRGTVPVKSDRGEVKKIVKKTPVHASPDDENLPVVGERGSKQRHDESPVESVSKDYSDEHIGLIVDTTDDVIITADEHAEETLDSVDEYSADGKKDEDDDDHKGINLDVTV